MNRMYQDLAYLWPLISPPEDYAEEARYWREALRAKLGPGQHEILELGVGGGHNLSHLTNDFQATAVDLSEQMLAHSRRLNPGVEHHVGDMRTFRLGRTFKAVIVHDAISYMLTEDDLGATFHTAKAHLEPGGIFIAAPDWYQETFPGTNASCETKRKESQELTLFEYSYDPDPTDTTIETLYFFILNERGKVQVEQDRHVSGLFSLSTWVRLMEEAGFAVEKLPYLVHEDGNEAYLLVGVLSSR